MSSSRSARPPRSSAPITDGSTDRSASSTSRIRRPEVVDSDAGNATGETSHSRTSRIHRFV
jgi:hypothetical protein